MREPLHPAAPESDKTPREKFIELGKRLMAVPKPELDAEESRWKVERERQNRPLD